MVKGLKLSEALRTNPLSLFKMLELKGLKRFASPYCYNYPWAVQIEITNNCNLRCKTCPRLLELETKGSTIRDMDFNTFKNILDNMKHLFWVIICGRGEPLLNKDIFRMTEYAVNKGIPFVLVATNGTLLHGKNIDGLIQAQPRGVGISIDSPSREGFRNIRNFELDKILANIKAFTSAAPDISVGITSVLNNDNINELLQMPELCANVGAEYFRVLTLIEYDTDNVKSIQLDKFDQKQYSQLNRELKKRCREKKIELVMQKKLYMNQCPHPFNFANIDVDGNLTLCCVLPDVIAGNVLEQDFFSVWNSKKMLNWRKMLIKGNYPKMCTDINCTRLKPQR